MRNLFLILFIILFMSSCSDKKQAPTGILSKQKMEDILWDIIRAEEFLNNFVIYRDTGIDKAAESRKWYDKIYQLHKVTKKDFDRSYAYYNDHPALLKEILDSLSKKEAPAPPGQAIQSSKDTLIKKDTVLKKDTLPFLNKKRLLDSLSRKRILKKISPANN